MCAFGLIPRDDKAQESLAALVVSQPKKKNIFNQQTFIKSVYEGLSGKQYQGLQEGK
jgi:hypothetical protein